MPDAALTSLAAAPGPLHGATVIERRRNPYAATFPSEVIRWRTPDGRERRLFCKHGGCHPDNPDTPCGSVQYEAAVYRDLLPRLTATPFVAAWTDRPSGLTCLVLDYLDGFAHANRAPDQARAMTAASRWIGAFHARGERQLPSLAGDGLTAHLVTYDADHYRRWPRRTARLAATRYAQHGWLPRLCEAAEDLAMFLAERPRMVLHGDYYADNALVNGERVCPVDWGWAAIGAGEVDLAALVDRWPADIVEPCVQAYREARWPPGDIAALPDGAAGFARALDAACLFEQLRWLGHKPEETRATSQQGRLEGLQHVGERLGLI